MTAAASATPRPVLVVSKDMLFSSRVEAAASRGGRPVHTFAGPQALETWLAKGDTEEPATPEDGAQPLIVIVDLRQPEAVWRAVVEAVKPLDDEDAVEEEGAGRAPELVAVGPHKQPEQLRRALEAGCDAALPNSRLALYLDRNLG